MKGLNFDEDTGTDLALRLFFTMIAIGGVIGFFLVAMAEVGKNWEPIPNMTTQQYSQSIKDIEAQR